MKVIKLGFLGLAGVATVMTPRAAHADVQVHVESNTPDATLERVAAESTASATGPGGTVTASGAAYELVCTLPCDKSLDRNAKYVFRGVSGFGGTSGSFVLPARDSVQLTVMSGSQQRFGLGVVGLAVGSGGVVVAGAFAIVGATSDSSGFLTPGLVGLTISVPILVAGIVLMVKNGTTVTTERNETLAETRRRHKRSRISLNVNGLGGVF